jgi:hypothetical protein
MKVIVAGWMRCAYPRYIFSENKFTLLSSLAKLTCRISAPPKSKPSSTKNWVQLYGCIDISCFVESPPPAQLLIY